MSSDAPIDSKVKSSLICDLFNLISIPPLNIYQHLNEPTKPASQIPKDNDNKMKMEAMLIIKRLEEEKHRCRCFIRIDPCEEMFEYFLHEFPEEKLHLNQLIHQYFYPNHWKKSSHSSTFQISFNDISHIIKYRFKRILSI